MKTLKDLAPLLSSQLGVEESNIHLTSALESDLGADSLDRIEFSMTLEDTFGIEVPDAQIVRMSTVQDVLDLVNGSMPS